MDHELDVSHLPPPEPMLRILDALETLPKSDRLVVHHRRQPFPLYDILRRLGYHWEVSGGEGEWQIAIAPAQPTDREA